MGVTDAGPRFIAASVEPEPKRTEERGATMLAEIKLPDEWNWARWRRGGDHGVDVDPAASSAQEVLKRDILYVRTPSLQRTTSR